MRQNSVTDDEVRAAAQKEAEEKAQQDAQEAATDTGFDEVS